MSGLLSNSLFLSTAAAAGGLQIERSLRFNSSDSAYLSRTPASAGNRKTWTWAGWVKRSGALGTFFRGGPSLDSSPVRLAIGSDGDKVSITQFDFPTATWGLDSDAVFRDYSAWYHFVFVLDTTQATASNRFKFYVNNVLQTLTQRSGYSSAYPAQNAEPSINTTNLHDIGQSFSGYLANIHFINGQALTPSSFTETDATTGQLIPKTYTGSYGTNGFNLLFADNSSNTASTLGKDTSGNSNNWTPNNLSVTAGAGNDSLVDSPTNYGTDTGVGGEVRGNYCTGNPLAKNTYGSTLSFANGNLDWTFSGNAFATIAATSGKWYAEVVFNSVAGAGRGVGVGTYDGAQAAAYFSDGTKYLDSVNSSYSGVTYTTGDIIGIAWNADSKQVTFYKNNASQGAMTYTNTKDLTFIAFRGGTEGTNVCTYNFGQRAFAYTAPSGFKALNTQNLPAPLVTKSNTVMDVITYTGTGSSLTLPNGSSTPTSIAFTPDFVWLKGRSGATDHAIYDSVRDVQKDLVSNSTAAETTQTTGLTAFGTNTFTVGSLAKLNTSSATYVGWAWDAGTSTVSNTAGSITSQVRANATAGFSVITYTGTGSTATIGHGLGVVPGLIIVKPRSIIGNWITWHSSVPNTSFLLLNDTQASTTGSNVWNNTSPTSTVFTIGTSAGLNTNGATHVAYCFAPVVGHSSFGSYTGNGSSDGPFVYLGFRPRWIMLKKTDTSSDWWIYDSARQNYNVMGPILYANNSDAEYATDASTFGRDLLSNGFKVRNAQVTVNGNGATYIYAAFAEAPFNYARAR